MVYVFLLSKENLDLSKEEVLSLLDVTRYRLINNLLFLETDNIDEANRLSYTKRIYRLLFETTFGDLFSDIKNFDWEPIYKKNFCVRFYRLEKSMKRISESKLGELIWNQLSTPKVNLKDPETLIEFFSTNKRIYVTRLIMEIKHDFESRRAHKRPEQHPTALDPRLARALINLCGARGEVMDPFCGAGGILIEAGLMGLRPVGYDLYDEMLRRARVNLDFFGIRDYRLFNGDALSIKKRYDFVVTDLPYGLNTSIWVSEDGRNKKISLKQDGKNEKIKNLENFYFRFLRNLRRILGKRAVVLFPHYVKYRELVKKAGFNIKKEFSQFVHKSLTRKILVLS